MINVDTRLKGKEGTEPEHSKLICNIEKLHTTELGVERIKKNVLIDVDDVVKWCKDKIQQPNSLVFRQGKNWYVETAECRITINALRFIIITAHKKK